MRRIAAIDYLRFLAALSVLGFHYFFNGIENGKISSIGPNAVVAAVAKYGYLGVYLFFIISGYVIFFSAHGRTAEQFAVSRAVRLYPAYVVAMLFTSSCAFFWGGEQMSVTLPQVLANLAMFEPLHRHEFVDGVYWTLTYEISFYLAVFMVLFTGQARHLNAIFRLWPWVLLVARGCGYQQLPLLGEYYVFFAAGGLFALASERRDFWALLGLAVCLGLSIEFCLGQLPGMSSAKGAYFSPYWVGALVCSFYLLFFVINRREVSMLQLPGSRLAGALTYPLYLVHAHVGYMFISRFADEQNRNFIYVLCIAIVLGVAFLIHEVIEVRLAAFWKGLFEQVLAKPVARVRGALRFS